MSLLAPAALALAVLVAPLIALYMLRTRRRRVVVPSTMLWGEADTSTSSAVPWQRLRWSWLLLLQLLLLLALVLALARPFMTQRSLLGPHTVFVIDTSGSMASSGRFESAIERAVSLSSDASNINLISVVEAGPLARVVTAFSSDPGIVRRSLEALVPTGGQDDLAGGIALARGLESPDRPTTMLLFSDGGDPELARLDEPIRAAEHLLFDRNEANVGISAFALDSTVGARGLFLEVGNYSDSVQEVTVEVRAAGVVVAAPSFRLEPRARGRRSITVEVEPGMEITGTLTNGGDWNDALALDDEAAILVAEAPERRVVVLGEGSVFLDALLASVPGVVVGGDGPPDMAIVDGSEYGAITTPVWLIKPETPPDGIDVVGVMQNTAVTFQRAGEPILDNVDLSELVIGESQLVTSHTWLPIVQAGEDPLILVGDVGGQRAVYFTFDITRSNLPTQVAFPILGAQIIDWLTGSVAGAKPLQDAGSPILFVPPAAAIPLVARPDGNTVELAAGTTSYTDTGVPGIYRVTYRMDDGTITSGPLAVRRFVESEAAANSREIATIIGVTGGDADGFIIQEWTTFLLIAILTLAALEWWVGHQRPLPWRRARVRSAP
jgi:hypothetical protein